METRPYRMKARADRQAATRQRIVEAAVELHTTLGPARTSISAIAERAGVQRHTVYAHFPDEPALFGACSGHWAELHPFPDPERWLSIEAPKQRLRRALRDVYAWYVEVDADLALFIRDEHVYPPVRDERESLMRSITATLAGPLGRRKLVKAAVGHALEFETWRSLTHRQGLSNGEAVDAMVALVESA